MLSISGYKMYGDYIHWKDWCWSWNPNTLATWCEELTHWKRPWSWERLKVGREGDDRGWHGWMASSTQAPGVGDGQGGLACCDSWSRRESDTTEWLNWTGFDEILHLLTGFSILSIWFIFREAFYPFPKGEEQST